MIKSMTGYGRGNYQGETTSIMIEVKTINHRYNEVVIRGLQNSFNEIEQKIRAEIKKRFSRGKFELFIKLRLNDLVDREVMVNRSLAKEYVTLFNQLKKEFSLSSELDLNRLLSLSGFIEVQEKEVNQGLIWRKIEPVLDDTLSRLEKMRLKEGQIIYKDITKIIKSINRLINKIEKHYSKVVVAYRKTLDNLIRDYLDDKMAIIDENRFYQELINYTDKSNINEELVRFKGHISQFEDVLLQADDPVGRKFDFLIQEMNREINTIASKLRDVLITNHVVEIKSDLEKIREHIQNVE